MSEKNLTKSRNDSSDVKSSGENSLKENVDKSNSIETSPKKPTVSNQLNDSKENKSKYRKVGSRYQESAKQWAHKRNDDSLQNKSKEKPTKSCNTSKSRNPTPNSKARVTKASTPVSSDKSLNCSAVSAISCANDCQKTKDTKFDANQDVKKYGKGLVTSRKSVVSRRELYPSLKPEATAGSSRGPMSLLPAGHDSEAKSKEIEKSISRANYLQSVLLNLKAKQIQRQRNSDAINRISEIWNINNELRLKLQVTQNSVKSLENTIKKIEILEKQKNFLEKYLSLREQMDPLYNSFAQLIDKQKLLLKIDNCTQTDFDKLNDLLKCLPQLKQMESFEKLSKTSLQTQEFSAISSEIESLKAQFSKYAVEFDKLIKKKQKYENTEKSIYVLKQLN